MNILKQNNNAWPTRWAVVFLFLFLNCSPDQTDDAIPYQPFPDIVMNLNLPENTALRSKGGYRYISGGIRGIILYNDGSNVYYAYERNCSFHPNEACATVDVDVSTLFMIDPCCNSQFDFSTGNPRGGAAWRPLRKYRTMLVANTLTITDEIVDQ
ncbi:MAG TPA: hypothetical protein VIU12_06785 [Chryseolinea sp.]